MKVTSLISSYDSRIAIVPDIVKKMVALGISVVLENGFGSDLFSKREFIDAGASFSNRKDCLTADCLIQVVFDTTLLEQLPKNIIVIALTRPFDQPAMLEQLAQKFITTFSMEFVPRSTRAQKMDVLSSQASLAGYVAVMLAANTLDKVLPMMMTPAGTLSPSRVFVVGAGVAGLQAIATAKRLGANVIAFDTRPVAEEQVQSLGANFLKIDLGEMEQTSQGYAKQLSADQLDKQREAMVKTCSQSDIIITTAQVFGRKAPIIITKEMIKAMKPGSVIVDCAADSGGNVEGVELGKVLEFDGVTLMGLTSLSSHVAKHASQMYASNVLYFLEEFFDKDSNTLSINREDDIINSMLTTYQGKLVQPMLLERKNNDKGES